jgi:hypothetical protein
LFVTEVYRGSEIAKFKVFHEFVIGGEAAWWTAEITGIIPVQKFADRTPFLGARCDGVPDSEQGRRLRMPQTARSETATGLKIQVEAGRVNVFASMGKPHGDVCFVGTLVMGESRVAVDAKHGTARRAGIGDEMRSNFGQERGEVGDKTQDGLAHAGLPLAFVAQEPGAIVVPLEAGEKPKEFGGEVNGPQK